jgi:plastocyanin
MTATPQHVAPAAQGSTHARWGRRIGIGIAALLVATLVTTAPILSRILRDGAGQEPIVGVTEIVLTDDWFTPSVVEVPADTVVTFRWDDGETPHDIVFADDVVAEVRTTGSFERQVPAGELRFHCTLHPGMNGRLVGS